MGEREEREEWEKEEGGEGGEKKARYRSLNFPKVTQKTTILSIQVNQKGLPGIVEIRHCSRVRQDRG